MTETRSRPTQVADASAQIAGILERFEEEEQTRILQCVCKILDIQPDLYA